MNKGKIIVIEGTDCSGKETQTRLLVEKLESIGKKVKRISFPMYDTPTGKIIGACLLGKPDMCADLLKTDHGLFPEGGGNVDSLAAIGRSVCKQSTMLNGTLHVSLRSTKRSARRSSQCRLVAK